MTPLLTMGGQLLEPHTFIRLRQLAIKYVYKVSRG
jgi:hypothetical protein